MKIFSRQISGGLFAGLAFVALAISFTHPGATAKSHPVASIAPFIVQDTQLDSPETNLTAHLVVFSAEIDGSPAPTLQWKMDKGGGFTDIPGATNTTYRIGIEQVAHNEFFALFATNPTGNIHTTPQRLFVEEGED